MFCIEKLVSINMIKLPKNLVVDTFQALSATLWASGSHFEYHHDILDNHRDGWDIHHDSQNGYNNGQLNAQ